MTDNEHAMQIGIHYVTIGLDLKKNKKPKKKNSMRKILINTYCFQLGSYYQRWKLKFQFFRIVVIIYQETIRKHNAQCQLWLLYDEVLFPCFRSVLSLAFFNLWLLITFTINWTSIRLFYSWSSVDILCIKRLSIISW